MQHLWIRSCTISCCYMLSDVATVNLLKVKLHNIPVNARLHGSRATQTGAQPARTRNGFFTVSLTPTVSMIFWFKFNTGVNNFFTIKKIIVRIGHVYFTTNIDSTAKIITKNINTSQRILMPSKMPIYVEKYAICALCWNMRKMRQRAKYAVIAYSHKTDMPRYSVSTEVSQVIHVILYAGFLLQVYRCKDDLILGCYAWYYMWNIVVYATHGWWSHVHRVTWYQRCLWATHCQNTFVHLIRTPLSIRSDLPAFCSALRQLVSLWLSILWDSAVNMFPWCHRTIEIHTSSATNTI